jgi:hypothetical protein
MEMRRAIFGALLVLVVASVAHAQTVVNPTAIRFESASHTADELQRPTSYAIDFYNGATLVQTNSVPYASVTAVPSTTPQLYEATFAVIGTYPAGTAFTAKVRGVNGAGTSAASNAVGPFGQPTAPASPTSAVLVP